MTGRYERAQAAQRIRSARQHAGIGEADVAAAVGINVQWYGHLETDDDEAFQSISLAQLARLAKCLGLAAHELVGPSVSATDPIPMSRLIRAVSAQLEERSESVEAASDRIGWDLTTALADHRMAWRDWNVDCLQDVCRAVGLSWGQVLASWSAEDDPGPQDVVALEGPVEVIDGKLTLRIPLAAGGDKLAPLATGIGAVVGEYLDVIIQPWLAEKLRIGAGSLVCVDNRNGKFTITRSAAND